VAPWWQNSVIFANNPAMFIISIDEIIARKFGENVIHFSPLYITTGNILMIKNAVFYCGMCAHFYATGRKNLMLLFNNAL
jgi:hypothetical protein